MSSRSLMQNRWLLPGMLLLLAVVVGLSTLFAASPQSREPLANRSIYNTGPSGYRAWWLVCQKSGLGIAPWEKPFDKLTTLPESATMLVVDPFTFARSKVLFGEKEAATALNWVRRGNTLVLLDDFHRFGSHYVAQQILARVKASRPKAGKILAEMPKLEGEEHPASDVLLVYRMRNVQNPLAVYVNWPIVSHSTLTFLPHGQLTNQVPWQTILTNGDGLPVLIRMSYGKGTLILGTVKDLGDNSFLHGPSNDNYQFLANLLRREGKLVFVNEYVHAYQEAGDLMTFLSQNTPLGVIFVQLVLGFILLLWLSAMRWTPKPVEKAGNSTLGEINSLQAYIQSMARIYARVHAAPLALGPQLNRIEVLLRQRHRLTLDDETRLSHLLGTSPGDYSNKESSPESLVAALHEARQVIRNQERLTHRDLLQLARKLTLIEERLQYERHRTHVLPR